MVQSVVQMASNRQPFQYEEPLPNEDQDVTNIVVRL